MKPLRLLYTKAMDLINTILHPEKLMSTCFLCFNQKTETLGVYQKLFIYDENHSSDTTLADIMNYLFPSHDILCNQACEDCTRIIITTYTRLRRHNVMRETLNSITTDLTKKIINITLSQEVSNNVTIPLRMPVIRNYEEKVLDEEEIKIKRKKNNTLKSCCKKCDMRFTSKEYLTEHYRITHKNINKAVVCEFCGKDCKRPSTLRAHLNCHKEKICPYCSKTLKAHTHYKIHLENHKTKVLRTSRKFINYSCNMCSYQSLHKNNLEAHINKVHLQSRPYVCGICDKGFYRKSHLTEHILIHEKVKKFTCELCGVDFVSNKTLTEHIRLHTGEKPYECEVCKERFVSSGRRSDHFKRRHMEKTYSCLLCDKKYGLRKELNAHMKKIHGQM